MDMGGLRSRAGGPRHLRIDLGVRVRVLLFGPEAAAVRRESVEVEVAEPATCEGVRSRLAAEFPALRAHLGSGRFAVNHEFAPMERAIRAGDEVALIGLVSGG